MYVCRMRKKCSKQFPKNFAEITTPNPNGYPIYRRRNNGISVEKFVGQRCYDLDNRWVAPYSPYLCKKYNCHTNVECVFSIQAVKYLYKYILKGNDMANVRFTTTENHENIDNDEITRYEVMRYLSDKEACWHIFGYPIHEESHSVVSLAIHLPLQQNVVYHPGTEHNIVEGGEPVTTLTAWFNLNATDEEAK